MRSLFVSCVVFAAVLEPAVLAQQTPPSSPPSSAPVDRREAADVAQGWSALAQGPAADAAARATQILDKYPRSTAALVLAVDAHIARGGSSAGLDQYESWLGRRALEEPGVLRRIAQSALREVAGQQSDPTRLHALEALARDQDPVAVATLNTSTGDPAVTRLRASMGDPGAVKALLGELQSRGGDPAIVEALGRSGSRLAIEPLGQRLKDPKPEVRGAAADALARLDARSAVPSLKSLLSDDTSYVRVRAAAALYRLEDDTGLPLLQELTASESTAGRLIAAEAIAVRPDANWQGAVRALTGATEPEIRIAAARLIAPYDPELASSVLDQLSRDNNPVIRELASRTQADGVSGDLTTLRHLMRSQDGATRVRAAGRVLELTR